MNTKYKSFFIVALGLTVTHAALAETTAFDLAKDGDAYVGVQSKDKIVQIRSDESVMTLAPNIWYVTYYDPDAMFKSVEVKFGAGKEMNVSHPVKPFQPPTSESEILDKSKLNVDSDRALKIATSQPLLKDLTLKASKLTLENSAGVPVWKVELWAAKLKNPNDIADIGLVILSANDGSVIKTDLHPDKVE
jgi:hypothetical protein